MSAVEHVDRSADGRRRGTIRNPGGTCWHAESHDGTDLGSYPNAPAARAAVRSHAAGRGCPM